MANHDANLPLDQVLVGDCRQVLDGLPENSIDLIFADPYDFAIALPARAVRPKRRNSRVSLSHRFFVYNGVSVKSS